jgi:hypothetical protein
LKHFNSKKIYILYIKYILKKNYKLKKKKKKKKYDDDDKDEEDE